MSKLNWNLYYNGYIGLSNARMSAELAIATAMALDLKPEIFIDKPLQHSSKTLFDLFDFNSFVGTNIGRCESDAEDLWNPMCTVIGPSIDSYTESCLYFAGKRNIVYPVVSPEFDITIANSKNTLGFYSNLVYPRPGLSDFINNSMTPKRRYQDISSRIISGLGTNNYMSIHVRRGDKLISEQKDTPFDDIKGIIDRNIRDSKPSLLVVHTDESSMDYFAKTVFDVPCIVLERFFKDEIEGLDGAESGLVSCLVASESSCFAGTLGSTMTSMIQRQRMLNGKCEDFRFLFSMFGAQIDDLGRMFVKNDALFSWDRYDVPAQMYPINFWAREWPESVM